MDEDRIFFLILISQSHFILFFDDFLGKSIFAA